jgi:hypothetical protein
VRGVRPSPSTTRRQRRIHGSWDGSRSRDRSRRRRPKKKARKPASKPRTPEREEIPLDETTAAIIERQFEAFRAKFGRDPEGDEPIFFDPDCDVPAPFMPSKLEEETVRAMKAAGIHPKFIHAFRRTGRVISEDNLDKLSPEAIDEWNEAIEEYREWQAMAEEALRSGAHPAIAYAIGKTGKLAPENVELSQDGTHAVASGEDADWLEAFNEFVELHPETVTEEFTGGAVPGKDRVH